MRRILSVWLPNWPILRLQRSGAASAEQPVVTVASERGQRRLACVCPLAAEAGLRVGQALAEARALCPALDVHEAVPEEDAAALGRLAEWATRFTPLAAADPPEGLWLDIAGCAHLHGGEDALCAAIARRLGETGFPARLAVADASGAAWALARCAGGGTRVVAPGGERAALEDLPVGLLRLDDRAVAALRRVGIRRIGALAGLPRAEVAARFGALPALRLEQAFGTAEEPIAWPMPARPWQEARRFAEPIAAPEDLMRALALLAEALGARLEGQSQGARRFVARFLRVDGGVPAIGIATARPVRDAAYVLKLLAAKLETVDPGFGVEAVTLEAQALGSLAGAQAALDGRAEAGADLAATLDTLIARLGEDALWRPSPLGSHVPERAVGRAPPLTAVAWPAQLPDRPLRLFTPPEPIEATAAVPDDPPLLFRWRGRLHRVRAAAGPERIAAEWWRRTPDATRPAHDFIRDYYRVEDQQGGRFWVFRVGLVGVPRWFLHGVFG
ncbi:MAG: DNA polymerase Y family protein [Acetobacteraceae bacterium]|nr:DNA polymerase Y family protein [Acetobacteraceae bacterium]